MWSPIYLPTKTHPIFLNVVSAESTSHQALNVRIVEGEGGGGGMTVDQVHSSFEI